MRRVSHGVRPMSEIEKSKLDHYQGITPEPLKFLRYDHGGARLYQAIPYPEARAAAQLQREAAREAERFASHHHRGEWFNLVPEIQSVIDLEALPWTDPGADPS